MFRADLNSQAPAARVSSCALPRLQASRKTSCTRSSASAGRAAVPQVVAGEAGPTARRLVKFGRTRVGRFRGRWPSVPCAAGRQVGPAGGGRLPPDSFSPFDHDFGTIGAKLVEGGSSQWAALPRLRASALFSCEHCCDGWEGLLPSRPSSPAAPRRLGAVAACAPFVPAVFVPEVRMKHGSSKRSSGCAASLRPFWLLHGLAFVGHVVDVAAELQGVQALDNRATGSGRGHARRRPARCWNRRSPVPGSCPFRSTA